MRRVVVNLKDQPVVFAAVRVDRRTPWGNPFVIPHDGDRNKVCDLFEAYAAWRLLVQPNWLDPLRDKDLACWCAPSRCHADTLMRLANRPPTTPEGGEAS